MVKGFTHESIYNESVEWYTPREVFESLGIEFDLDPCSPGKEIVPWIPAKKHLTVLDDGLSFDWGKRVWLNPPYGSETEKWLKHLSKYGNGVALIFARTDTLWFHKIVPYVDAICFIKGRLNFIKNCCADKYAKKLYNPKTDYFIDIDGKKKKSQPGSASMLLAFGKDNTKILEKSGLGITLTVPHVLNSVTSVSSVAKK